MALSGSFITNSLTEYGCTVSFTFKWSATQSVANNRSTITYSLTTNMNPTGYTRGVRKVYITRGGTEVASYTWSYDSMKSCTNGTVVYNGSFNIDHNSDGTKTFSFNVYVNVGRSAENTWTNTATNKSVTLDTIPRASSMSLSPANPSTISTITASVTRASDSFTHTITTAYNGTSYTLGTAKFATSTSITIPTGIRSAMKSNNVYSVALPVTLTTYNSNTVIGTKDYTLTINVPTATVSTSRATVACNANITWTLGNVDTSACTYTVERTYNSHTVTDQTKATTTSKQVANGTWEGYITSSTSGVITVKVTTYVGTTVVGSSNATYTCTIPTGTYKPTLAIDSQLSRVNIVDYKYRTGITYLSGYDGATGKITEGKTGSAAISARSVTVSGNNATATYSVSGSTATINTGAFNSSNTDYNVTVTYTVRDTRGTSASVSFNAIVVRGYSKPTFTSSSIVRANSSGKVSGEGTYANITATAVAHSVKNTSNTEINKMSAIQFKIGTTSVNGTVSGLNGTISNSAYGGSYSISQQYTFTLTATDYLGQSTTVSLILPKATVTLSLHKENGIGLGTVAEKGYINVALPLRIPTTGTQGKGIIDENNVSIIRRWDNKNVTVDACNGTLFLGFQSTNGINILNGKTTIDSSGNFITKGYVSFGANAYIDGGSIYVGTSTLSSSAANVVCRSIAGDIYFRCGTSATDYKDIWVKNNAGSYKNILRVDQNNVATFYGKINGLVDMVYPVGSIYMSVNSTSPATLFGGTWKQIKGRFLLGTGQPDDNSNTGWGTNLTWNGTNKYNEAAGSTGGESLHTLTVAQMPSHTHEIQGGGTKLSLVSGNTGYYRLHFSTGGGVQQMLNINTGGGGAHNNMPPYLVVYMWKRTA